MWIYAFLAFWLWVGNLSSYLNVMQEGDFEMKYIDRVGEQSFNVAIAPFSLSILGDSTEAF